MREDLPIQILEPQSTEKRALTASMLGGENEKIATIAETIYVEDIKKQLRQIREYTRDKVFHRWGYYGV